MLITSAIHDYLTNISTHGRDEWVAKRVSEISNSSPDGECIARLRTKLVQRIESFTMGPVTLYGDLNVSNISALWETSIIDDAVKIGDVDMLVFFDRLMTKRYSPELLRIVFVHATNMSIPLEAIDTVNLEAYMGVTETMMRPFSTKAHSLSIRDSESLIKRILGSTTDARNAVDFMTERGYEKPEDLITYLDLAKDAAPALALGVL